MRFIRKYAIFFTSMSFFYLTPCEAMEKDTITGSEIIRKEKNTKKYEKTDISPQLIDNCSFFWEDYPNFQNPYKGYSIKVIEYNGKKEGKILVEGEQYEAQMKFISKNKYKHLIESSKPFGWYDDFNEHCSFEVIDIYVMDGKQKECRLEQQRLEKRYPMKFTNNFIKENFPVYSNQMFKARITQQIIYIGKNADSTSTEDVGTKDYALDVEHVDFVHDVNHKFSFHLLNLSCFIGNNRISFDNYRFRTINYPHREKILDWINDDAKLLSLPRIRKYFTSNGNFGTAHEDIIVEEYEGQPKSYDVKTQKISSHPLFFGSTIIYLRPDKSTLTINKEGIFSCCNIL